jgi:hypothetical protein
MSTVPIESNTRNSGVKTHRPESRMTSLPPA